MLVEVTLLTSVALAAVMHFGAGWGFGACAAIVAFSLLVIDDGNKYQLRGRAVMITGGGMGIGQLTCLRLAREGVRVLIIWDIIDPVETVAKVKEIAPDCTVLTYKVDVSNAEMVNATYKEIEETLNKMGTSVSVVINNAGVVSGKPFLQLEARDITRTLNVNTFSHFYINKAFLPEMLHRNDGFIVTISSVMGIQGAAGLADYCASKFALMGLHEAMRLEILKSGRSGVRTLLFCPFGIATGMFSGIFEGSGASFIQKYFFPMLIPQAVADRIVDGIMNRELWIVMPSHLKPILYASKFLPVPVQVWIASIAGGEHGMDNFKGRGNLHGVAK